MYNLAVTSRYEVKRIAGKIIPAIATTTSVVAGLVCLEVLRYVCKSLTKPSSSGSLATIRAKNHFLNLALPTIFSVSPARCWNTTMPNGMSYTLWDRWSIQLPSATFTVSEFIAAVRVSKPIHFAV